jgi:hypothetical protein
MHSFCEIIVTLLFTESPTQPIEFLDADRKVARPFFAAFFVLQQLLEDVKPDLDARYERMLRMSDEPDDVSEAT